MRLPDFSAVRRGAASANEHAGKLLPYSTALALVLLPWESESPLFRAGTAFNITLPELAIAVACGLFLLSRRPWPFARSTTIPAATFVLALLLSAAAAPSHRLNSFKFAFRMAAGLLFCASVGSVARERRGERLATCAIALSALVPAALGIVEWFDPTAPIAQALHVVPHNVGGLVRSHSVFPYPTVFAGYLEMALPFALLCPAGAITVPILAAGVFASLTRASMALTALIGLGGAWLGERMRSRRLLLAGLSVPTVFLLFYAAFPSSRRGLSSHDLSKLYSARMWLLSSETHPHQDDVYAIRLMTMNSGEAFWNHEGKARFYLSYWVAPASCPFVKRLSSLLPADVPPGGETSFNAYVHLPAECARVEVSFDMFSENVTPFYIHGSPRLDLSFRKTAGIWTARETVLDPASFPSDAGGPVKPLPSRSILWRTALRLWGTRPLFGVGPDNFRLMHGQLLPEYRTDPRVFSNNLFLEILCGSGIVGLAAFLWFLLAVGRHISTYVVFAVGEEVARTAPLAAALCLAGFLAHGLVDCMILFTPIYALFWGACGLLLARSDVGGIRDT